METLFFHVLSYHEFNNLIKEKYPYIENYDFVPMQECSNDSEHAFYNINVDSWDIYDDEQWTVDIIQNKEYFFSAEIFLRKLVKDGYIEPGNYLIEVMW